MSAAGAPDHFSVIGAPWIEITGFQVNFAFTVDHLTLIMLGVVTGVGFLIHVYSVGYMAARRGLLALLRLPEPLHVLHAGAGAGRELPADVRWLGGRRPRLVPADRLLLQAGLRRQRRQEGVHRQPHRRLRISARDVPAHCALRHARLRAASSTRSMPHPEWHGRLPHRHRPAARSSAPPASPRRFRSTSGCRTRWKAPRRSPR